MQALSAAWAEDASDQGVQQDTQVQQQVPSEGHQDTESNQQAEKPNGLFYDVDPNSLTPELRRMFDGMQASYTQRQQELAEQRKQLESFGNIEQVQQAVEFVNSLSDPQNLVQLHTELSEYLQQAGYTKADADAAAASAIQEQQATEIQQESDYGFSDPEVAQLKNELADMRAWRDNLESAQEQARIEVELQRIENVLRQDRNYNDADISRVYNLSYAYGADLVAAADAYDSMKNDLIRSYIDTKAEAPTSIAPPTNTAMGQRPESFGSDFEAAHRHAKQIAIAAMNAGAFD